MNKIFSCAQKCYRYEKTIIGGRITTYISLNIIIYPVIDKAFSRVSTTRGLYFTRKFFSLLSNKYISNISNLYNWDKNSSLGLHGICVHMFSDPKSDHTFHTFWLRTWIIFFFLSYVAIVHLLRRWEGVGIYRKLILGWIKSTPARTLFPARCRPYWKYYFEIFLKIVYSNHATSLTLFILFDCNCIHSLQS